MVWVVLGEYAPGGVPMETPQGMPGGEIPGGMTPGI